MDFIKDITAGYRRKRLWKKLAILELKARYQGAYLGAFWIVLALMIKVGALSLVYSMVLDKDFKTYVMFLALGVLTWNYISAILVTSGTLFKKASHFMLQMKLPHSIFVFQNTYREVISLVLYQLFAIPLVILINGFDVVSWVWLWALLGYVIIVINGFFVSMWLGWAGIRFPDVQPLMASVVMILFLVTPVLWPPPEKYIDSLYFQLNPFYHLLELIRAPILHGQVPYESFAVAGVVLLINLLICLMVYRKVKDKLVLWM
ncbi:ABC transporter permease [Marinicella rhabdoformis]|uniref:ABC transporter permease n=1 Tax=Marinicella rhabdoformis TaxID=2580566 RepID=UPI0012AEB4E2|nr:ABC transporter permease [Marinicella rhabdoformis]